MNNDEVIIKLAIFGTSYNTNIGYTGMSVNLSQFKDYTKCYICIEKFQSTMTFDTATATNIQYNNICVFCQNLQDVYKRQIYNNTWILLISLLAKSLYLYVLVIWFLLE